MQKSKPQVKIQNWRKVKLGEILELKYGYGLTEKNRENGNVPVFGSSGVVGKHGKAAVNSEGVIIGRKGNVGSVYYSECPFYPIDTVYYIDSLKIPGHLKFFYYFLKRIPFKSIGSDVGVPGLNRDIAYGLDVNFPEDVKEQKRIAEILSAFDEKIELNNKINQNLEQMAQAIFKKWFALPSKALAEGDELPKGWEVRKIGKVAKVVLGGTPSRSKPEYWGGNIPWINSGKTNEFRIISASEYITESGLKNSNAQLMPKRTTVIAITGATLGQVSLLEIEVAANQSVVGVFGSDVLSPEVIYLYIKNKIQEIVQNATGGAQQHINKGVVEDYPIIVPEEKIAVSFNKIISPIFDQISNLVFENQKLSSFRDLLLPKLMSGEVRVKV